MKAWTAAAAALALAACTQPASDGPSGPPTPAAVEAPSGEYALDSDHTTITVRARHFGLSFYQLRFNAVTGALNFNAEDPTQSTVEATVATTSLDTPYSGNRNFDEELQNSEWLDAANSPTATFRSTSVELTGSNTARVTGDITIRGQTRPITLDVTFNTSHRQHPMGPAVSLVGFSARGLLNRADFGVGANRLMPSSPDATDGVSNQVELIIEAEFTRPLEGAPAIRTPAEPVD